MKTLNAFLQLEMLRLRSDNKENAALYGLDGLD